MIKQRKKNHEIYYLFIANILFNLNSCNILCRYYQKVLSTLINDTFTFSFNFYNPAIIVDYFLSWYQTYVISYNGAPMSSVLLLECAFHVIGRLIFLVSLPKWCEICILLTICIVQVSWCMRLIGENAIPICSEGLYM